VSFFYLRKEREDGGQITYRTTFGNEGIPFPTITKYSYERKLFRCHKHTLTYEKIRGNFLKVSYLPSYSPTHPRERLVVATRKMMIASLKISIEAKNYS